MGGVKVQVRNGQSGPVLRSVDCTFAAERFLALFCVRFNRVRPQGFVASFRTAEAHKIHLPEKVPPLVRISGIG